MTAAALPIVATLPLTLGGGAMPAAAAAAATASPLIPPGPATVLHHGPTPWAMDDYLGGALCDAPKVCKEVRYDWIQPYGPIEFGVTENVERLDKAIHTEGTDPKIVYAYSGGARIAAVWLKDHAKDKDAPPPEDLSFVLLGNGGRKYGGVNGWFWGDMLRTPTNTQYDILDVAAEYDPIADFPTNPFNLLAVANGVAAFVYVHLRYQDVDLDNPDNIVWTEGKTTYVFAPTEHLPLLQGFYDAGLGDMVAGIEPKLRAIVDKAYDRTWLEGKPTQGEVAAESGQSVQSVTESGVRPQVRAASDTTTVSGTTTEAGAGHQSATPAPTVEAPQQTSETASDSESPDTEGAAGGATDGATDDGTTSATPGTSGPKHRMPLRGFLQAVKAELTKDTGTKDTDTKDTETKDTATKVTAEKSDTAATEKTTHKKAQKKAEAKSASSSATGGGGDSQD
ncbi:PE-PPE domain-containing protein [Mycolicibacterium sp. 018/SC-01/001]|nr:PE-PPE domain-containing protein [Mycolicibacterium sp. 018/SC-01/001]